MEILKSNEYISEKLNIQPLSSDRLQKEADSIPNFYLYKGRCGEDNGVYEYDVVISDKPLPQYDNNHVFKKKFVGLYHSFDKVKDILDNSIINNGGFTFKQTAVFSVNLKDYAFEYYKAKSISSYFHNNHVLFCINKQDQIFRIYSKELYEAYINGEL